ncbi:mitochondrial distribution and morphology protein 12 [Venturia nashicola]|uniref:Mitochondrial distribution and morphology protein 12 n=1 Tax=Venturia nashicola TaxID=86259 RepID=A0A4Z1PM00_9PEZI|nr:mitochondrial distribution and morphology protein 12 [Venturia nashicola]TLD38820.1 mitochondrial distribution and morphology protein 12 [Venturia nashicola]
MSVVVDWSALTEGADGIALTETIRAFLDDKIQQISFPKNLLRAARVSSFDLGTIPPDVELKDICDPLPDFYDDDEFDEDDNTGRDGGHDAASQSNAQDSVSAGSVQHHHDHDHSKVLPRESDATAQKHSPQIDPKFTAFRGSLNFGEYPSMASPLVSSSQTPGIPGGTSNLNYFHLPFGPGLSGTTTPLAAVAGAHFHGGWPDNRSTPLTPLNATQQPAMSSSSLTPPSTADPGSRPPSQHQHNLVESDGVELDDDRHVPSFGKSLGGDADAPNIQDQTPNDIQIVTHVRYTGDMRLSLTAEILLDYPMPSFVGIPLKLNITGLRFDGVAILAYIKKRAHVCFLSPEHAEAFAGSDADPAEETEDSSPPQGKMGGLLEEIKVESEIGQKEPGKQVLKNVGKVEKFILEQVRRIFEDEFVYPSYWTFLV